MKFCIGPVGSAGTERVTSVPAGAGDGLEANHRNQTEEGRNQNLRVQQNRYFLVPPIRNPGGGA